MSLARCDEEFLIGELALVLPKFVPECQLVERRAIDDLAWDSPVLIAEVDADHEPVHLAAFRTFQ